MKNGTRIIFAFLAVALVPILALAETPPAEEHNSHENTQEETPILTCCKIQKDGGSCEISPEVQKLLNRLAEQLAFEKSLAKIEEELDWYNEY